MGEYGRIAFVLYPLLIIIVGEVAISYTNEVQADGIEEEEEQGKIGSPNVLILYIEHINLVSPYLWRIKNGMWQQQETLDLKNIDTLIKTSLYFEHAYGEMTTISSSASLMTGKPAVDTGIIQGKILPYKDFPSLASSGGLPHKEMTIAHMLHKYGHFNAFVGQWKLGLGGGYHLPVNHGFDVWTGVIASNTAQCKKVPKINRSKKDRLTQHPYVNFIRKTIPFWMATLAVLLTLYYLKWIHLKGLANALVYTICASLILYLLMKALQVQKLSACVLYKNSDIIEQPYDTSNFTQYLTLKALKFLRYSSQAKFPFYLHLSYLLSDSTHLHTESLGNESTNPYENMVIELEWSIGKIMNALKEHDFVDNTIIVLTGGNDCFKAFGKEDAQIHPSAYQHSIHGFQKGAPNIVQQQHYHLQHSLEHCLKVPLLLSFPGQEQWESHEDSVVSLTDVLITIDNIMANYHGDEFSGFKGLSCSLVHKECSSDIEKKVSNQDFTGGISGNTRNASAESGNSGSPSAKDSPRYSAMCETGKRILYHYADIIKPVAVTLPGPIRVIFANVTDEGKVSPLSQPVVFPLLNLGSTTRLSAEYVEAVIQNATQYVDQHLSQDRPNRWTSQFEMPIYPWFFPCANFPRCEKSRALDDFGFLDYY